MAKIETAATGSMKLMLMTLVFAPEKQVRFETCGWKLESGNTADLVMGDVALPANQGMPTVDEVSASLEQVPEDGSVGDPAYKAITGCGAAKKDVPIGYA